MKVGFIGFGEAASSIAAGLHEEGVEEVFCFDAMQNDACHREGMREKCRACSGIMLDSAADVCGRSDIVICAVPSNHAEHAAVDALPGIHPGSIYVDVTTASPSEKRKISIQVEAHGAVFVDAAMLGALLKDRHQVPMLLCGSGAKRFMELMEPYHMNLTFVKGEPGAATSIKFIRSITAKGLSCLLFESLQAARKFGVDETIVESFLDSFGPAFETVINGYLSGAIIHAERREHEMQNVVDFLKQEGLPFTMAEAARQKLKWIADEDIKGNFDGEVGRNWRDVLAGWNL